MSRYLSAPPNYRAVGRNRILLLRETDGDGRADLRQTLIGCLRQPYGMQLIGGDKGVRI